MRKPEGTGVCWPIISFTLATALGVRVTGAAFFVTSGMVVVAIRISLALKLFDYSKCCLRQKDYTAESVCWLDALAGWKVHSSRNCNRLRTKGFIRHHELAHGAIIIRVRPSPGLDAGFCAPAHEVESRCTWVEPAEVAYDADDSVGCIWSFRRRSDHPPDLQEHAHHARGRSTVSG